MPLTVAVACRRAAAVANFAGHSIDGWEFVNCPESRFAPWNDRLSLDARFTVVTVERRDRLGGLLHKYRRAA
jgi:hypothetical protein